MRAALHFAAPIAETVIGLTLLACAVDAVVQGRRWAASARRAAVADAVRAAAP